MQFWRHLQKQQQQRNRREQQANKQKLTFSSSPGSSLSPQFRGFVKQPTSASIFYVPVDCMDDSNESERSLSGSKLNGYSRTMDKDPNVVKPTPLPRPNKQRRQQQQETAESAVNNHQQRTVGLIMCKQGTIYPPGSASLLRDSGQKATSSATKPLPPVKPASLRSSAAPESQKVVCRTVNQRRSWRRSFTTDDIDLGVSSSKSHGVGVSRSRPVPAVRPNKFSASTQRNNTALNTSQRRLTRQKSLSLETVEERPQRPLCPPKPKLLLPKAVNARSTGTVPVPVSERLKLPRNNGTKMVVGSPSSFDSSNMNEQERLADFDDDSTEEDQKLTGDEVVTDKAHKVAAEFLSTEQAYVEKLHLLDQVFHNELLHQNHEEHFLPDNIIPQIFSSIKSIYQFHHDFLLPQLDQCMASWSSGPQIGAVLKKFAPFLKLYTDYIKNFDNATSVITLWTSKSAKFMAFLDELQRRPECGSLTLQHHLLCPIQRVPRYELLLKEYIKHLDDSCSDKRIAEDALSLVTLSARHANEEMKKIDKFRQLLEINELVGGALDDTNPNRELIKEGKITKVSARDGAHLERYLFLFNDMLLVCMALTPLPGVRQQYKVKAKLDISGMKVLDGTSAEFVNTFVIKSRQKSMEVLLSTDDEKIEWQTALWQVITSYTKAENQRFKHLDFNQFKDDELGKRAPTWVRDKDTHMCMICCVDFTTWRRRHHCRSCGRVVCGQCSSQKAALQFDDNRLHRVCDACYYILGKSGNDTEDDEDVYCVIDKLRADRTRKPSILKVKANASSLMSSYLSVSSDCKNWHKRWMTVQPNFVLYFFKAHKDVVACKSLPLPGYQITSVTHPPTSCHQSTSSASLSPAGTCDTETAIFKVFHPTQTRDVHYFLADTVALMNQWMSVLERVTKLELPQGDDAPNVTAASSSSSSAATASKPLLPVPTDVVAPTNSESPSETEDCENIYETIDIYYETIDI